MYSLILQRKIMFSLSVGSGLAHYPSQTQTQKCIRLLSSKPTQTKPSVLQTINNEMIQTGMYMQLWRKRPPKNDLEIGGK